MGDKNIKGYGEIYSFWDADLSYGDVDNFRHSLNAYWTSQQAGFGFVYGYPAILEEDIPYHVEYGPSIVTTGFAPGDLSDIGMPPYVMHHQQVRLTSKDAFPTLLLWEGPPEESGEVASYQSAVENAVNVGGEVFYHIAEGPKVVLSAIKAAAPSEGGYLSTDHDSLGNRSSYTLVPLAYMPLTFPSDCWYNLKTPFNEEDIEKALTASSNRDFGQLSINGSVMSEYGDYIVKLDEVMLSSDLHVLDIPNIYLALGESFEASLLGAPWSQDFNKVVEYLYGDYCPEELLEIKAISTGYTDILVSAAMVEASKNINNYKEYFSLRADTEFSISTEAPVADDISGTLLECRMMKWMVDQSRLGEKATSLSKVPTHAFFERLQASGSEMEIVKAQGSADDFYINTYDLFQFVGWHNDGSPKYDIGLLQDETLNPEDMICLTEGSVGLTITENAFISDSAQLGNYEQHPDLTGIDPYGDAEQIEQSHMDFVNLLTQKLKDHNRTFQQVVGGKEPYSETMAYRISKYYKSDFGTEGFLTTDQLEMVQYIINYDMKPISNVWLANSSYSSAVNYVDTQVKYYPEEYVYVIWAYQLVIGTRYFYSNLNFPQDDNYGPETVLSAEELLAVVTGDADIFEFDIGEPWFLLGYDSEEDLQDDGWTIEPDLVPPDYEADYDNWYNFTTADNFTYNLNAFHGGDDESSYRDALFMATTMPTAVIKEVPYFVWPAAIIDKPPSIPDIKFVPYCNNDSELLMLLNPSAGTYFMDPIIINEEEQEIFDEIKMVQGLYTGLVEFGNNNPVEGYEIYRMTEMPSSYSDFAGNLLTTVSTVYDKKLGTTANAASYIDGISPNTKYYYTFRSVDAHNHFSNPTAVFEVEMISGNDIVIPSVQIVDMAEESSMDKSKAMNAILHIVPRITQAIVNSDATSASGDEWSVSKSALPVLGVEDETLWGRTFKIRLVSRKTKRQFDINVTFGQEFVENSEYTSSTACPEIEEEPEKFGEVAEEV